MLFVGSYADNNSINADNDSLKGYKTSFFSSNKKTYRNQVGSFISVTSIQHLIL